MAAVSMAALAMGALSMAELSIATAAPAIAGDLTLLAHEPSQPSAHPPLIVLLHGSSADERDMITMWRDLPPDFVVVSPRAPFAVRGGGYRWYRKTAGAPRKDDLALSRKIIDLVVDEAVKRFHADPRRVFLGGFSQGAVMTYAVALAEPGRFRGAVVLSGSMLAAANVPQADRSHEAFFIGHGTADKRIPFSAATSAKAKLANLGVPVAFHAYTGLGHETGAAELRDLDAWVRERADERTSSP